MGVHSITIEHIDPRNGVLVSGLCNEFNEVLSDSTYNIRKTNRFVPYRVCAYPAPTTFGDLGEFLVDGVWTVCEFGGPEWWEESNKIGNACITSSRILQSHPNTLKNQREQGRKTSSRMNEHPNTKKNREKIGESLSIPIVLEKEGVEYKFVSQQEASRSLGIPVSNLNKVLKGERKTVQGYTANYQ